MPTSSRCLASWLLAAMVTIVTMTFAVDDTHAQECLNWGDLDKQLYCDESRDLVADTPSRGFQLQDPDTLVFSFTPVENADTYKTAFAGFMAYLAKRTGKNVRWHDAKSSANQIAAMRAGKVHVAGVAPGPTVYAVNLAGYVPIAVMCRSDGTFGDKIDIVARAGSGIETLGDLKGRKVAVASRLSYSGDASARAMFRQKHAVPGKDYDVVYSGSQGSAISGVAAGTYDAAIVDSSALARMQKRAGADGKDVRLVWSSRRQPPTSYGFAHNLAPDLQRKIHDAFLTFGWNGSGLAAEFGGQADGFCTISYEEEWGPIRLMQKESGVTYDMKDL